MAFDLSQYKVVRSVTREFFVIPEDGKPMYLKFESAFVEDPTIQVRTRQTRNDDGSPKEEAPKKAMEIADVVNLETGEIGRLIGNEVVKSELRKTYPSDSYVGHVFEIRQGAKKAGRGGNTYRSFKIVELVGPDQDSESQSKPHPVPAKKTA